jgi:hypothetical protein
MRQLPAPWSAEKTEGGYRVRDKLGRTLCYIYCRDDEKNAEIAKVLTWEGRQACGRKHRQAAGASKAMRRSLRRTAFTFC